jgi:Ca2+-binding RTX toxin-like protein
MKKSVLTSITILLALAAPGFAHAKPLAYNVLLAGGTEESLIQIWLTPDGRSYVIDSVAQLEVGGSVCEHPPGNPNELVCHASMVASFEVNTGSGDDTVTVAKGVPVPVTMRGGSGRDILIGGDGPDKLIGGEGDDRLGGRAGDDLIFGGDGSDLIFGGPGKDVLRGGLGEDRFGGRGGGGDDIRQELGEEA